MASGKKEKEPYLKIPNHILNLAQVGLCEKVLLCHIYSFGAKGCWQSNKTLGEIFMVSASTIKRWLRGIRQLLYIKAPKGYCRTMWAKSHPAVRQNVSESGRIYSPGPNRKCATGRVKNGPLSGSKRDSGLDRNRPTTNNQTITETTKGTTATPSPLPAGGQASALLASRKKSSQAQIEQFKARLGISKARALSATGRLTAESFQRRRTAQIQALLSCAEVGRRV